MGPYLVIRPKADLALVLPSSLYLPIRSLRVPPSGCDVQASYHNHGRDWRGELAADATSELVANISRHEERPSAEPLKRSFPGPTSHAGTEDFLSLMQF
jgi:hypothetical protein